MTVRNKLRHNEDSVKVNKDGIKSNRVPTPGFNDDRKLKDSIVQSKTTKNLGKTTNTINEMMNSQDKAKQKEIVKLAKKHLGPMKQNSKFNPEIARILDMMEKKNRVVKTKIITKYQLSKTQYLKLLEENKTKNKHKFMKPKNQSNLRKTPMTQRNKSELSMRSKYSEHVESATFISRNNKSKIIMKKTALNLLMDKSKQTEYMHFTSLDDHMDEKLFGTQTFDDKSRMTFGNGMQSQALSPDRSALSPMHGNLRDTLNVMKRGTVDYELTTRLERTQTSWLPIINPHEFPALPKIKSRRNNQTPTRVYVQR